MSRGVLDHLSLGIRDLARAAAFYDAVCNDLGFVRVWTFDDAVGYGPPGGEDKLAVKVRQNARPAGDGTHIVLNARSRDAVDHFHRAALECGGADDGTPGLRPKYGPGYYAAFVRDPDGHAIEAVFHENALERDSANARGSS